MKRTPIDRWRCWGLSFLAMACALAWLDSRVAWSQRIRFPEQPVVQTTGTQLPPLNPTTQLQTGPPATFSAPTTIVAPPPMQLAPATAVPFGAQAPGFDPYGGVPVAPPAAMPQTFGAPPPGVTVFPPANSYPYPSAAPQGQLTPPPPLGPSPYGTGWTGQPYGQVAPNATSGAWPSSGSWPSQMWSQAQNDWMPRLLAHTRFRNTYLFSDGGDRDLMINDAELATTLTFAGCCCTRQPFRVSPGFIFHFWDGPDTAVTGVDLPAQAYSTYLSADFNSPFNQTAGYEANLTVGLYTDFDFLTDESIRITGVGLGWIRIDPTTTFKLGVEYLDRVDIKLLPAIGLFMMPSTDFKFDLYFPRPKFARRFPSSQNYDVWGYLGGEYGGGSWTIERTGGMGDQVDINDIRIFIGAEWLRQNAMTGFLEVGYVFNRELFYRSIGAPIPIDDTFMVRAGFAF